MKMIKLLAVAGVFCVSSAYAVDPQLSDMTCDQLRDKFEATADALERFADLQGACDGVYTIDDALYVRTQAVIRSRSGGKVTLYLPATDHTFSVTPDSSGRVWVGNRKVRVRDLNRGDELGIYLSVDKLATERVVTSVAFATEDTHTEEIIEVEIEEEVVEALPTTG